MNTTTMTHDESKALEELQIQVARLVGWTHIHRETDPDPENIRMWYLAGKSPADTREFFTNDFFLDEIPHYPTDLNAMHQAEKLLNEKQAVWYLQKLTQVRYKDGVSGMIACMIDKTTFATARQRAEALIATFAK